MLRRPGVRRAPPPRGATSALALPANRDPLGSTAYQLRGRLTQPAPQPVIGELPAFFCLAEPKKALSLAKRAPVPNLTGSISLVWVKPCLSFSSGHNPASSKTLRRRSLPLIICSGGELMFLVFEHRDLAIPFQSSCALFSNKAPLPRTSRSCHLNLNSPLDSGSHFGGRGGAGARSERGNCSAKLLHSSIATSSFLAYINILERWQGKVSSSSGTWREGSQERVSGGAGGGKAGRRLAGSQGTPEVRRLPVITATRGPQLQNTSACQVPGAQCPPAAPGSAWTATSALQGIPPTNAAPQSQVSFLN